jgi:hypothetical protein
MAEFNRIELLIIQRTIQEDLARVRSKLRRGGVFTDDITLKLQILRKLADDGY